MPYLGFESLATIKTTKLTNRGLAFNLLVVGQPQIGKTTLIESLFDFDNGKAPDSERCVSDVLHIKEYRPQNEIMQMKLTIIETKTSENYDSSGPMVDYIKARYEDYMKDEFNNLGDNDFADTRVHCCIYMICPIAGLKPSDLETMKKLHQLVCLIPIIGRMDSLTAPKCQTIKETIKRQITENGIEIYSLRDFELPLAVAVSEEFIVENGKRQRVIPHSWGCMYIERDTDFPRLRNLILKSDMLGLIETTNRAHYVKYRRDAIGECREMYEFFKNYEKEVVGLEMDRIKSRRIN